MHVIVCQKKMEKEEKEEAYFFERKRINQRKIFIHGCRHHIVILNKYVIGVPSI